MAQNSQSHRANNKGLTETALSRNLLLFLAAVSGACGLAYEILYVRIFSNYFGDGFVVSAIILSAVFLGISFGAWHSQRFYRHLALIEIAIGLYAFFIATLVKVLGFELVTIGGSGLLPSAIKLAVFLIIPTFLIGTCVPLFARYIQNTEPDQTERFTLVYALYNLGAVISVIAIEFILFRKFGLVLATYFIGLLNLALGSTLFWLLSQPLPTIPKRQITALKLQPASVLFLVSFASGIFQLYFLRLSYSIFGPLHENFAIILTSAILGITLGSTLVLRWHVALSQIVWLSLGSFIFFMSGLGMFIHLWSYVANAEVSGIAAILTKIAFLLIYPLPVFVLLGVMVPLAYRAHYLPGSRSKSQPAIRANPRLAGQVLAVSSLANGLGALSMVMVIYQFLPLQVIGLVIGLLLIVAAILAQSSIPTPGQVTGTSVLILVGSLSALQLWPQTELRLGYRTLADSQQLSDRLAKYKSALIYKAYNQDASLVAFSDDITILTFNGYRSLTFGRGSMSVLHEQIVGASPVLFGKHTQNALVLGLGTGITAGSAAQFYDRVKVVEINPAILNIPRHFINENAGVLNRSNVEIVLEDGISALLSDMQKYDVIINTVTSPQYYSASKLYTAEFFEVVKQKLNDGGIYSGWFDMTIDRAGISIMLNTLEAGFAHCRYFLLAQGYFNVICGEDALIFQPSAKIDGRAEGTNLGALIQKSGFEGSFSQVLSDLEMDFSEQYFDRDESGINRLDQPIIEFIPVRNSSRLETHEHLKNLIVKNVGFRRKISFGSSGFLTTCRNIERMSFLQFSGC